MGTHFLILQTPYSASRSLSNQSKFSKGINNISTRCGPAGGRFRFESLDNSDEDHGSRFARNSDQRAWWSDYEGEDEDDMWMFEDEEGEFWVFKVFKSIGWTLPAVAISLLLGNGPDAFVMALVVPLAQSALSLAFDKVWGRTSDRWRPTTSKSKMKRRKKGFSSTAANNVKTNSGRREEEYTTVEEKASDYQSWVWVGTAHNKGAKKAPNYGGWDQLVMQMKTQTKGQSQKAVHNKAQKMGKLSRTGRVREKPLFMRLLIAAFPFLGSWNKLLF